MLINKNVLNYKKLKLTHRDERVPHTMLNLVARPQNLFQMDKLSTHWYKI